jgi:hypothetical protein
MVDPKALTPAKRAEYRTALDRLRSIEIRHRDPKSDGEKELHRIAHRVLEQWDPQDNRRLLDLSPGEPEREPRPPENPLPEQTLKAGMTTNDRRPLVGTASQRYLESTRIGGRRRRRGLTEDGERHR